MWTYSALPLPSYSPWPLPPPAQESKDPEAIVLRCCPTKPARYGGWRLFGGFFVPAFPHERVFSTCLECESHSGDRNRAASCLRMIGGGSDRR